MGTENYICSKCKNNKSIQYKKIIIEHSKLFCFIFRKNRIEEKIKCNICGKTKKYLPALY